MPVVSLAAKSDPIQNTLEYQQALQMQWTKRGARLLLPTRTRMLDGKLRPPFEK